MLVEDHDLLDEQVIVKLSTDTAHIVTESGESACGLFEFDLDKIRRPEQGRVVYESQYFGHHGLIHAEDSWSPANKSLCHYCNQHVPDDLQADLFTDDTFELVDDLTVGEA